MSDTKTLVGTEFVEDASTIEHDRTAIEIKKKENIRDIHPAAGKCKFGEEKQMTKTYFDELLENCDVPVDDVPLLTKTNISSYGASSCKFFLLTGIYQDENFSYLDHDVSYYENDGVLNVLYSVLDFIVNKFEQDLIGSSSDKSFNDLKNIRLIIGGGEERTYDVLRHAFSLLINPDANAKNETKRFFNDSRVNILYDKLVENVIILKSVAYLMSDEDEAKKVIDPSEVINTPSLALYYDCVIDRSYIAIEWGKGRTLVHLAYMLFGLYATEKPKLTLNIQYDQIEQIKEVIADQQSDQVLLEKALGYISDDPLFNTVYTDSDILF
ncbi:hypothetical protein I4U23_031154 [Adineta vaga]|nr:hypothetical protein I4U23_031154 [Adineta vaga]